jgi:hypothetical protein
MLPTSFTRLTSAVMIIGLVTTVVLLIKYVPSLGAKKQEVSGFAVIMPFIASQKKACEMNIRRWMQYEYYPTTGGYKTDLILYYNLDESDGEAHDLQTSVSNLVKDSMFNVKVMYANLTQEEDVYPMGSSSMFYKVLETESIRKQYTHVFFGSRYRCYSQRMA